MEYDKSKWTKVYWPRNVTSEVNSKVWSFLNRQCGYYQIIEHSDLVAFQDPETALAFRLTFGFPDITDIHLTYPFLNDNRTSN